MDALYLPRRVEIRQADVSLVLAYKRYAFDSGLDASQLQQGTTDSSDASAIRGHIV